MQLMKIEPGEACVVELTTRPTPTSSYSSSGCIRIVDEHGRQLGTVTMFSNEVEIKLVFETPLAVLALVPREAVYKLAAVISHP